MPNADDIQWFKQQFHQSIEAALAGTSFGLDMIVSIACQETGHIWPVLRRKDGFTNEKILALCVGDTLDADKGRSAFPKTKADLLSKPNGQAMFDIARDGLVRMAAHIAGYASAAAKPNKFCHGFGLFQYDLQFFLEDPDYFLQRRYEQFDQTLGKCLGELKSAQRKVGLQGKASLSDLEFASVAIAYNTGGFKPSKGLKQGHFNGTRFYGEEIFDFVRLSRTVAKPGGTPQIQPPAPDTAIVPPPTPVEATGKMFIVDTKTTPLRLRAEPKVSSPPTKNVVGQLPDGVVVRAVTGKKVSNFIEVETSLSGAHLRGFASVDFLKAAPEGTPPPQAAPAPAAAAAQPAAGQPTTGQSATGRGIPAIMPRRPGTVTKRTENANAHSLNEPGQPSRKGATPAELVASINDIIDWLAVDKASHKRYKPRDGLTFCNIYAHDFCHLAGAYFTRVWWTGGALRDLEQGKTVQPLIENTITEMRANDIFRWLIDHGADFGWRRTSTPTKLQEAANQGAIALIIARRKQDGKSGHVVMVVPEGNGNSAIRNAAGEVTSPLQSQAGASNFRFGTGNKDWWKGDQFADSAFWIHS